MSELKLSGITSVLNEAYNMCENLGIDANNVKVKIDDGCTGVDNISIIMCEDFEGSQLMTINLE